MKNITIFILLLFSSQILVAQSYRTAVGLRLGTNIGISAKQKVAKFSTLEAIFAPSLNSDETSFDLLFAQHKRILSKRFNIYVGGGLHKAWREEAADDFGKADAGIAGIIGGEFSIRKLNLSWDWKPTVDLFGGDGTQTVNLKNSAVTVRYIFVPQKKNEDWKVWKKDTRVKRREDKAKEKEKEERKARRKKAGWRIWEW